LSTERTLAIIKPDAVGRGISTDILARIHSAGFKIAAIKSLRLTKAQAEGFYAVHSTKGFFGELTAFMSSGKVIVIALEAEGAILKWRETMAPPIRQSRARHHPRDFGASIQNNCTHGSDARKPPHLKSPISSPATN